MDNRLTAIAAKAPLKPRVLKEPFCHKQPSTFTVDDRLAADVPVGAELVKCCANLSCLQVTGDHVPGCKFAPAAKVIAPLYSTLFKAAPVRKMTDYFFPSKVPDSAPAAGAVAAPISLPPASIAPSSAAASPSLASAPVGEAARTTTTTTTVAAPSKKGLVSAAKVGALREEDDDPAGFEEDDDELDEPVATSGKFATSRLGPVMIEYLADVRKHCFPSSAQLPMRDGTVRVVTYPAVDGHKVHNWPTSMVEYLQAAHLTSFEAVMPSPDLITHVPALRSYFGTAESFALRGSRIFLIDPEVSLHDEHVPFKCTCGAKLNRNGWPAQPTLVRSMCGDPDIAWPMTYSCRACAKAADGCSSSFFSVASVHIQEQMTPAQRQSCPILMLSSRTSICKSIIPFAIGAFELGLPHASLAKLAQESVATKLGQAELAHIDRAARMLDGKARMQHGMLELFTPSSCALSAAMFRTLYKRHVREQEPYIQGHTLSVNGGGGVTGLYLDGVHPFGADTLRNGGESVLNVVMNNHDLVGYAVFRESKSMSAMEPHLKHAQEMAGGTISAVHTDFPEADEAFVKRALGDHTKLYKDNLHFMLIIFKCIRSSHRLAQSIKGAIARAFSQPVAEDFTALEKALSELVDDGQLTAEDAKARLNDEQWIRSTRHVRFVNASADAIIAAIEPIILGHCGTNGLFTTDMMKTWVTQKATIKKYAGEPASGNTHRNIAAPGKMPVYKHNVGTNKVEAFNRGLQELGLDQLGLELGHLLTLRYVFRWNLTQIVESLHRPWYYGVSDIILVNQIIDARQRCKHLLSSEKPHPLDGLVKIAPVTRHPCASGFAQFNTSADLAIQIRCLVDPSLSLAASRKLLAFTDKIQQGKVEDMYAATVSGATGLGAFDISPAPFATTDEFTLLSRISALHLKGAGKGKMDGDSNPTAALLDAYSNKGVDLIFDVPAIVSTFNGLVLHAHFDLQEDGGAVEEPRIVYGSFEAPAVGMHVKTHNHVKEALDARLKALVTRASPGWVPLQRFPQSRMAPTPAASTLVQSPAPIVLALAATTSPALPLPPPPPRPQRTSPPRTARPPKRRKLTTPCVENVAALGGAHSNWHSVSEKGACPFARWAGLPEKAKYQGAFVSLMARKVDDGKRETENIRDKRNWLDAANGLRQRFLSHESEFVIGSM